MSGRASRSSNNIDVLRGRIAHVDAELGHLLARRSHLVGQIQALKLELGWPHEDGNQERLVGQRLVAAHRRHHGDYSSEDIEKIAQALCAAHEPIAERLAAALLGPDDEGHREGQGD